jgi:alginate O-acetyltransferase complex protein AlgI
LHRQWELRWKSGVRKEGSFEARKPFDFYEEPCNARQKQNFPGAIRNMLFHSTSFLFAFLPVVWVGWLIFLLLGRHRWGQLWLTVASWYFYAYWNPPYLALLLVSLGVNFLLGCRIDPLADRTTGFSRRAWLWVGLAFNLGLLGYFKYANFFVDSMNAVLGTGWNLENVLLPLAISFFTFQQIAYLVDTWAGKSRGHKFWDYAFFVSFFPQLIAGPIVHHAEMIPQLQKAPEKNQILLNLQVGVSIFILGLFKKMVLADSCGEWAGAVFSAAADGGNFTTADAWAGVLSYTFQIYFDFSGYSDMAIGLARMFGLRLPQNFAAPYRATSIVEFWRRWHITLSRFLRDYLYIPLGGNRHGFWMRYRNLLITMLLGGLWHGAGWTFVIWGGLHGLYLVTNHAWDKLLAKRGWFGRCPLHLKNSLGWAITMLAVIFAWVFFRADSFQSATAILAAMAGGGGEANWGTPLAVLAAGTMFERFIVFWFLLLAGIVLLLPTTQSYFRGENPVLDSPFSSLGMKFWCWQPKFLHGLLSGILLFFVIRKYFSAAPTEFLYFNF